MTGPGEHGEAAASDRGPGDGRAASDRPSEHGRAAASDRGPANMDGPPPVTGPANMDGPPPVTGPSLWTECAASGTFRPQTRRGFGEASPGLRLAGYA